MPGPYELKFRTDLQGADQAEALAFALKHVADSGKASAAALTQLEGILAQDVKAGNDLKATLQNIAAGTSSIGKGLEGPAKVGLQALQNLETQAQKTAASIQQTTSKGFSLFGEQIQSAFSAPLKGLEGLATGSASSLGILAAGIAGVAVATGAAGIELVKFVNAQGELAKETLNFADRTGLTISQVSKLRAEAQIAGVNINTLETASRSLANSLEDSSGAGRKAQNALRELGVSSFTSAGGIRDIGQVTLDVLQKLSQIPDAAKRIELANQILGRGAKELQPLIANYGDLQAAVKKLGIGLDEDATRKLADANKEVEKLDIAYELLKKTLAAKIAPIVISVIRSITDITSGNGASLSDELARGRAVPGQNIAADIGASVRAAALDPATNLAIAQFEAQERAIQSKQAQATRDSVKLTEEGRKARIDELKKEISQKEQILSSDNTSRQARSQIQPQLDAARQELASLQNIKKEESERLRLEQELARIKAGELSGIAKINEEYRAQVQLIREKNQANPANLALAEQIRQEKITKFEQTQAVESLKISQSLEESKTRITEQAERDRVSRVSRLRDAEGKQGGDPKSAVLAELSERVKGAEREFEVSQRSAEARRSIAAQEFAQKGDILAFTKNIAKVQEDEGKAEATRNKENADAALKAKLGLIAITKQDRLEAQQDAANQRQIDRATESAKFDAIKTETELNQRLRLLRAQPGSEIAVELQNSRERVAIAQREFDITSRRIAAERSAAQELFAIDGEKTKLNSTLTSLRVQEISAAETRERAIIDNRYAAELKIAEIRKKQEDDFAENVGRAFDAASTRGADGLRNFAQTFAQGIERQIVTNVAKLAYESLKNTFSAGDLIGGQTKKNADGTTSLSTLGRILQGTPLGADPAKLALSGNTTATIDNTLAIRSLTGIVGSGAGGGIGGSASGVPGLFSGAGTNGIFTALSNEAKTSDIFSIGNQQAGNRNVTSALGDLKAALGTGDVASSKSFLSSTAFKNIALGGAAAAGIFTSVQGFSRGGASGIGQGIAGALGTAALFDPEPISKAILGVGALAASFFGSVFGQNPAKRDAAITKELNNAHYNDNTPLSLSFDQSGNYTDLDSRGQVRTSGFSNFPVSVRQPARYQFDGQNVDVPGQQNTPFVQVNIQALDTKSILDRHADIAEAVRFAVSNGAADSLTAEIRSQTRTQ